MARRCDYVRGPAARTNASAPSQANMRDRETRESHWRSLTLIPVWDLKTPTRHDTATCAPPLTPNNQCWLCRGESAFTRMGVFRSRLSSTPNKRNINIELGGRGGGGTSIIQMGVFRSHTGNTCCVQQRHRYWPGSNGAVCACACVCVCVCVYKRACAGVRLRVFVRA
jgi:hypothetical protein